MKQRIYYLDFAKVICAFLVIMSHLYSKESSVRLYLAAFHLPIFFLISGVFHKESGCIQWKKYFNTLIKPTLFFIVFTMILKPLLALIICNDPIKVELGVLKSTAKILVDGRIGVYWFLVALFWCKVMTDAFLLSSHKFVSILIGTLLLFLPFLWNKYLGLHLHFLLPFVISQGLMAMPFYYLGHYMSRLLKRLKPNWLFFVSFLICLLLNIWLTHINGQVSMAQLIFGSILFPLNVLFFYLNGIIGSMMILSICLLPLPKMNLISKFADALLAFVGFQALFNYLYREIVGWDQHLLVSTLFAIIIMLLCYYLHLILKKYYLPIKQ